MQRLGEVLPAAISTKATAATSTTKATSSPAAGAISNPIGLAIECVRRGVVKASESGLIFALGVARRAMRQGKDQLRLFWWLIRRPDRFWCGDDEWAGVKALLDSAGRTLAQLLRIASSKRREPLAVAHAQQGDRVQAPAVSAPRVAGESSRAIVDVPSRDQRRLAVARVEVEAPAARARVDAPKQQVGGAAGFFARLVKSMAESVEVRDGVARALRCLGFRVEHQAGPAAPSLAAST